LQEKVYEEEGKGKTGNASDETYHEREDYPIPANLA